MAQTLIPYSDLHAKGITLSKTQLWRNEKAGLFPKRVHVSAGRIAYVESEVDSFIAKCIASRDAAVA